MEHLNAEIVLNTIRDVSIALEWAKSTFLYIRMLKNPKYYGLAADLPKEDVEQHLQSMLLLVTVYVPEIPCSNYVNNFVAYHHYKWFVH